MLKKALLLMGIVAALLLAAVVPLGDLYEERSQRMSQNREAIGAAWEQAEKQIGQRAESIPRLVETARRIPGFEADEADHLALAVAELSGAGSRDEMIEANDQLSAALSNLMQSLADATKAAHGEGLVRLQDELATIEHRVSVARRQYNQAVQEYNTYLQIFPNNLVAWLEGFAREDAYFRTSEEERLAPPPVIFVAPPAEKPQ